MLRFVCVSFFSFAACSQSFDLGNTPTDASSGEITPAPTGELGATGATAGQVAPPTLALHGAWVKSAAGGAPSVDDYRRRSFSRNGDYLEPFRDTAAFTYQGTKLAITTNPDGTPVVNTHDSVIYKWKDERYPYLAFDVFRREGGSAIGAVGTWVSIEEWQAPPIPGEPYFLPRRTRSLKLLADGSAEHRLDSQGTGGPHAEPVVQPGTWSCSSSIECEVLLNGVTLPLHLIDENTLVDVKNDRWERAKTCETGGPITWGPEPYACPPVVLTADCQAGQSADWDGCFFTCVWPSQCVHVEASTCGSDADCNAGEVCNDDNVSVRKEDPTLSSVYGLCIKNRTLCSDDSACASGDFCSATGECEGL